MLVLTVLSALKALRAVRAANQVIIATLMLILHARLARLPSIQRMVLPPWKVVSLALKARASMLFQELLIALLLELVMR